MAAVSAVTVPRLQEWRQRRFYSPSALAERAKVNRFTIYNAEHGKRIRLDTARALAEALEIEPVELCEAAPEAAEATA